MATPGYSDAEVFQNHYGELLDILDALSKPVSIAAKLFAKHIITKKTLQQVTGQPDYERNQTILEAVLNTVKMKKEQLLEFLDLLSALDELSVTDNVITKMRSELSELALRLACGWTRIEFNPYGTTCVLNVLSPECIVSSF